MNVRRRQILDTALGLLQTRHPDEISLRELATHVGLAKSNVVRYFPSREAVLLEILDDQWKACLASLEELGSLRPGTPSTWAEAMAEEFIRRPVLCNLLAQMASVLERNISLEFAREFKVKANANLARWGSLLEGPLSLGPKSAGLAGALLTFLGGAWPYFHPNAVVDQVAREMGGRAMADYLRPTLVDGFTALIVGYQSL